MTRYTLPAILLLSGCVSPHPAPVQLTPPPPRPIVSAPIAPPAPVKPHLYAFLAWEGVSDALGYKVHWGTNQGDYVRVYDAGTNRIQRVDIITGTNFFAVTSYGPFGVESDYSAELAWKPDGAFWQWWYDRNPIVLTIRKADPSKPLLVATNLSNPVWAEDTEHSETNVFRNGPGGKFWRNGTIKTERY